MLQVGNILFQEWGFEVITLELQRKRLDQSVEQVWEEVMHFNKPFVR